MTATIQSTERVGRRLAQRPLQPLQLLAAGVAGQDLVVAGAQVGAGVDLVADVVVVQHDEQHRADLEAVPVALEVAGVVLRQGEAGLVGQVALRAVAGLVLVVAQGRHPRPVRGRELRVVEVLLPDLRLGQLVGVGVGQVAVDQVHDRVERLDRRGGRDGVERRLGVGGVAAGDVADAGEAERHAALGRGAERAGELGLAVADDPVHVVGVGAQALDPGVLGNRLDAVVGVGVGAGLGRDPAAEAAVRGADDHGRVGHRGRGHPRHDDLTGRVLAEGQVNLLGGDRVGLGGLLPQDRAAGHHETAGSDADAADERPARDAGALHALRHYCPSRGYRRQNRAMLPARKVGKPNGRLHPREN